MAIPFNLPTDEETEDDYRRIDQLLLDLYDVLRQILLRRRIQRGGNRPEVQHQNPHHNHHHHHQQQQQQNNNSNPNRQGRHHQQPELPDLVQSAGGSSLARKPPVPPPRRRRRRAGEGKQLQQPQNNQQQQQQNQQQPAVNSGDLADLQQGPSWLNVGIELRQIAEEFRSTQIYGNEEKRRKEIKASSLFSLLVPAPLTGSIWTTVIILVGWRILARHR